MNDRPNDDERSTDDENEPEYGVNKGADMTSEEIRDAALDGLADADAAMLVTANLCDDEDAVEGQAILFVGDEFEGDERNDLGMTVVRNAIDHAGERMAASGAEPPAVAMLGVGGGGMEGLIGALLEARAARMGGSDDDDDRDGEADAGRSMFG